MPNHLDERRFFVHSSRFSPLPASSRLERSGLRPLLLRACYPLSEWQPTPDPISLRKESLSSPASPSLQREIGSSSIARRIGHFLQVAPIETASARASHRFP